MIAGVDVQFMEVEVELICTSDRFEVEKSLKRSMGSKYIVMWNVGDSNRMLRAPSQALMMKIKRLIAFIPEEKRPRIQNRTANNDDSVNFSLAIAGTVVIQSDLSEGIMRVFHKNIKVADTDLNIGAEVMAMANEVNNKQGRYKWWIAPVATEQQLKLTFTMKELNEHRRQTKKPG